MQPLKAKDPEVLETQVAVIGAGGAGLCAAVAAAEKGMDVILLEKRRRTGGNTAMAMGLFAVDSPVQKREGINVSKDELFLIAMDFAHWTIDPRIMRAFINKSGDTVNWLEEKGINFHINKVSRTYGRQLVPPTAHTPEGYGTGLTQALTTYFEKLGGRLFCETEVKEILTREKEAVTGILAIKNGEEIRIKADSVIIATGDFGGDSELLKKYCWYYNEVMHHKGVSTNKGDGLLMGLKLGAGTAGMGAIMVEPGWVTGEPNELWYFTAIRNHPIWVNKKGERFVNEASYITRGLGFITVALQPDCIHYTLFDEEILREIIEGNDTPHFKAFGRRGNPPSPLSMDEAKKLLQGAASRGKVKISDSWDEIAGWMEAQDRLNPETLKATIAEYNSFCDQGCDALMAKEPRYLFPLRTPPFYAIRCIPRFLNSMGGLKINHHMEVLDQEGNLLIPGLYAVGDASGGWEPPTTYNPILYATFVGFAVNSGRIAGENAADFIKNTC